MSDESRLHNEDKTAATKEIAQDVENTHTSNKTGKPATYQERFFHLIASNTSPNFETPGPPPDKGLQSWLQVLAGHLVNAIVWGSVTSYGIFQSHYISTLHHTASEISWIGSTQIFLAFFIGTFSGRACDAGFARPTVFIGSLFLVFGTFMTSLATEYWQIFLAQGICVGLGMGLVYMPVMVLIGTYFAKNKASAVCIAASGSGTGGLVFPAVLQQLIPKIGFGWAVRIMAFIVLFFAITLNILIRPRLPPRKSGPLVEWAAFKEAPYTLFTIGMFLILWALYFTFFYIDSYARTIINFSDKEAVNLLLIINGLGIPARIICGYAADRWFGPINTLIPFASVLGVLLFCWIGVHDRPGLYLFAVFYGIFAACAQGLFVGALASLTKDLSKMGVRMGMVCSAMSFASLTGSPIAGAIIQGQGGSYVGAQIWGGTVVLVGCGLLLAARICETGWTLAVKM